RAWQYTGLATTQQIGRVRVHPKNPDIVYVAALGHMSGPNEERGVFRSIDGGKNWKKVLYKSNKAGAIDLILDPTNPSVIYASIWEVVRKPWTFERAAPIADCISPPTEAIHGRRSRAIRVFPRASSGAL